MGGFPGGYTLFYAGLLIRGNVLANTLAVGNEPGLAGPFDGCSEAQPVISLDIVTLNTRRSKGCPGFLARLRPQVPLLCGTSQ